MEPSSKVALVYCEQYELEAVRTAVKRGLDLLGGSSLFAQPGEKILIKPNLLVGEAPERNVSPHPTVFQAVLEQFQATGAQLSFGDSPGFGNPRAAARKAGLLPVADALGVPVADFQTTENVSFPEGNLIKQFTLAKGVMEADGLISLCKLKSHALTRITGAIKNQFGCIPGLMKPEFHAKLSNATLFSKMLVDLNLCVKPRLYIMDGIIGMEGNGPRNGTPRPMHVLVFSTDPVALDAAICRMVHLDESLVEPIVWGKMYGLGRNHFEILGDPLERFDAPDFQVNRARLKTTTQENNLGTRLMRRYISPRPVISAELCTKCGRCTESCPAQPKALIWGNGHTAPPQYEYGNCIRCYCCQELCPNEAITVKTPLVGRLIYR